MGLLQDAIARDDKYAFGMAADAIDWSRHTPEDTFLGYRDCRDRLRFAIDPSERFYFGPHP